jgi:predicted nucleic acid-binding protein
VDQPAQEQSHSLGGAHPVVLGDACSYIVLFAAGCIADVVADLPFQFAVVDVAKVEARSIRRGGQGEDAQQLVPIDWLPRVESGRITVLSLSGDDEAATYVELLSRLDDGEAATLAIAIHRQLGVATDDRVARALFATRAPHLQLFSTLEILHQWCQLRGLDAQQIGEVLRNVRERGRFLPPRSDPLNAWWREHYPKP